MAATRQGSTDPWRYLPATLSADRRAITFTTSHFSDYLGLGFLIGPAEHVFKTDFLDQIDGGLTASVTQPSCTGSAALRWRGYFTRVQGQAQTVLWCLGLSGSEPVLAVVNNRLYPLEVAHPHLSVLDAGPVGYSALASLSRSLSGSLTILAPGAEATFGSQLAPGHAGGVETSMDGLGQSLYQLQVGVNTLLEILTRFGVGSSLKTVSAANTLLGDQACLSAVQHGPAAMFAACFSPTDLERSFGARAAFLLPLMVSGPIIAFFRSEAQALMGQFNTHDRTVLEVARAVSPPGVWSDSHLTITPSSLGAVKTGMSLKTAGQAAGVPLTSAGDGFSSPTANPPAGMADLFVEGNSNGPVACVIASGNPVAQVVSTPEGFALGRSVARLKQTYGARAVYVPAPAPGGYGPVAGYVVNEDGGVLAFAVSGAKIVSIMGGPPGTTPSLCAHGSSPPRTSTSPPASESQLAILQIPGSAYSGKYPSQMGFSGDSSNDVSNISWASWTASTAVGNGIWTYESCNPDCASGPTAGYPAQIVLSDPLRNVYQKVTETTSGPHGFSLTLNYPYSSDPNFGAS